MSDPDKILPTKLGYCHPAIKIDGLCYSCQKKLSWRVRPADTSWDSVTHFYEDCDRCLFPSILYIPCPRWSEYIIVTYEWSNGCCDLDTDTIFDGEHNGYKCGGGGNYTIFITFDNTGCANAPDIINEAVQINARAYFDDNPNVNSKNIELHACWFSRFTEGCNDMTLIRVSSPGSQDIVFLRNVQTINTDCCNNLIATVAINRNGSLSVV